jgi:hypothetical protein
MFYPPKTETNLDGLLEKFDSFVRKPYSVGSAQELNIPIG